MNTSQRGTKPKKDSPAPRAPAGRDAGITPAPTGANRGSPAARVMKQFAKTKSESSGRS